MTQRRIIRKVEYESAQIYYGHYEGQNFSFATYVVNVRERVELHSLNYFSRLGALRDLEKVAVVDEDVILVVSFARHKQHLSQCE